VTRPPRLGLTQRVTATSGRPERMDSLDQSWTRFLTSAGFTVIPLPNLLRDPESYVDAFGLTGIVLTGGNDLASVDGAVDPAPERDALETRLLQLAVDRRLPVLGVCRGMQVMVRHHGGQITTLTGHAGTEHPIHFERAFPVPADGPVSMRSFHNFGVRREDLPAALEVAATAADGTIEAVIHRQLPQWGIMWHPERGDPAARDRALVTMLFAGGAR